MSQVHLPAFPPLDPTRAAFIAERLERVSTLLPAYIDLRSKLLRTGGVEVVLPPYDEYSEAQRRRQDYDTRQIIVRGRSWPGTAAQLDPMKDSNCHYNVAILHQQGRGTITSGYSLSDDGLWREHSWLSVPKSDHEELVETTVGRLLYYGYLLSREEHWWFLWSELGPDAKPHGAA
jgi:hypothetical protein